MRILPLAWVLQVALLIAAAPVAASDFPTKPVRLIVGYAPGGGTDIAARIVARRLSEQLGQQFIVDNRPGANGTIGGSLASKAPTDGYTLLIATSADAINASLYARLPYDLVRDFVAVSPIASTTFVLLVHPGVAAQTPQQLVDLARARPGSLNYATFGSAGIPNLAVELMKSLTGIRMEQIAYKGSGPALADLVAGQVDLMVGPMSAALPFVRAGRLRALGVAGTRRNPALPGIPTLEESGLNGVVAEGWNGVIAPVATPRDRVLRLNAEIGRAVGNADVTRQLLDQGYEPSTATPAGFADFIKAEVAKWGRVVKTAGIPMQ